MTGPEHYREAERLVKRGENDDLEPELTALDHQRAQIHATLALAAATALGAGSDGLGVSDWDAWLSAASEWKRPEAKS